ncbi:MAG: ArsR/SmtB family transcription factor [Bernardetiaceae bacterium]
MEEKVEMLARMARVLKVIAHPVKLSIVELLGDGQPRCVSQIQETLEVEQSLLSHYLIMMKDKGVLVSRREGKRSFYSLADRRILRIFDCMGNCRID